MSENIRLTTRLADGGVKIEDDNEWVILYPQNTPFYSVKAKALLKLAELEDEIERSQHSEPKLKVGDTVYETDGIRIYKSKITKVIYDTNGIAFDETAIGTSIFTTKAAAEARLKELQDKK
ncbi:MAG: hypothetical protein ACI4MN_05905 [Candidatus Coproplasma sp.]